MAGTAQNPTYVWLIDEFDGNAFTATWALTTANTDGVGAEMVQFTDLGWQVTGIASSGAVCTLQGSNDGTNWYTLTNASGGSGATFSADGIKQTIERTRYIRPSLTTAGTGATVSVILLARRNPRPAKV